MISSPNPCTIHFHNSEIAQLKAEHQQQIEEFKKQKKEITLIIENNNRDINVSIHHWAYCTGSI